MTSIPHGVHGKKWWLLRHSSTLYIAGFFIVFVPLILCLLFILYTLSLPGIIMGLTLFFVISGVLMVFCCSAYKNLYSIIEGSYVTIQDFNPVQNQIKVKNGREYSIAYFSWTNLYLYWVILEYAKYRWEFPPEFYQIWTPLKGYHSYWNRYHFIEYVRPSGVGKLFTGILSAPQRDTIFSDDLPETVFSYHKSAKEISSLRFVGIADEEGETILLALMTQHADKKDVLSVINLLHRMTRKMEAQIQKEKPLYTNREQGTHD